MTDFASAIPTLRIQTLNDKSPRPDGDVVLYWMIANRRTRYNFALQRAVEWSKHLGKPLVVLEALRVAYQWNSDRFHRFVIEGMADNAAAFEKRCATYYPYVEPQHGDGRGLLAAWAKRACVVVSDDFPCFFLPRMQQAAAKQVPTRFEIIDSNGLLPMRATDRVFSRAYDFRRFLQKNLLPHLEETPAKDPLARKKLPELKAIPKEIKKQWPMADLKKLLGEGGLSSFKIDHDVAPSFLNGGSVAAGKRMIEFFDHRLQHYIDARNEPAQNVPSGLSPYLHFGHISTHQMFDEIVRREKWTSADVAEKANGSSRGWWGARECVESYLDQMITWRELGFNMCWQRDDYEEFESLPDWAQKTMREHESDRREHLYSLEEFEASQTHDEIWNAAQRQLVREGRIHNYLRMLWGKKIYEWTPNGREALQVMIELNNKYALDGRNPNSYSGIFWILGRYDRAWGPERKVFGKLRYMSSDNTARKLKVKPYLEKYSEQGTLF